MRWNGGASARILLACVALLLPGGVLSATVVARQPAASGGSDQRVGVAGLTGSAVVNEQATTTTGPSTAVRTPVTAAPAASATTTSTRPPIPTTTTTRRPAAATSTTVPLTDPNWLTVPNIAPAGTWQTEANGVSMRLRIDPAVPVAGQPVRFFMDVSGPGVCCMVSLTFGEGSEQFMVNSSVSCTEPIPSTAGTHSYVTSHVYASPGAYKARMVTVGGDMCGKLPHDPLDPHWMPFAAGYPIDACIGVGPGPAGDAGCPRNDK
jgi:hypothetical protein